MLGIIEEEYCDYTGVDTCTMISETQTDVKGLQNIIELNQFNNMRKLLRVTTYVLKFTENCRSRSNRNIRAITVDEINSVTTMWIQDLQSSSSQEEIQYMNQTSNGKKPSIICQLGLYSETSQNRPPLGQEKIAGL